MGMGREIEEVSAQPLDHFIVSFLVPNLRLQTKRGFSRFVGE
jgi:hypothetical protein